MKLEAGIGGRLSGAPGRRSRPARTRSDSADAAPATCPLMVMLPNIGAPRSTVDEPMRSVSCFGTSTKSVVCDGTGSVGVGHPEAGMHRGRPIKAGGQRVV